MLSGIFTVSVDSCSGDTAIENELSVAQHLLLTT